LTHLLKYKNKSFFLVRFNEPVVPEDFNRQYALNKRVRVKAPQEGMVTDEKDFITIEECTKAAEKREVAATEEEWEKIRNTKIEDIVSPLHSLPTRSRSKPK
jgi:nicotinamide mononucleotide adenylyltransferase